jgi:pyruvate/2-oxoglutarate dehydrogenase complex dihydrolipoamide dehydrogenase (E3) component
MSAPTRFDAIIIGAGQGGGPLARAFAGAGRRTAVIERVHVGGTCINDGCTPTKTMVASARAAQVARSGPRYGVRVGSVAVNLSDVRRRKETMVERFRAGVEQRIADAGVELLRGQARFSGPHEIDLDDGGETRSLAAGLVVINTGQRPSIPTIPGLADVPFLTSTSIMQLADVPEHLIILGGAYVGCEFAQMFRRFGSDVTILQRNESLLPREDTDVADEIARILREDGIDVVLRARVDAVDRAGSGIRVSYVGRDGSTSIAGTHVLLAAGRTPNTQDLGLEVAGIAVDTHGYVQANERLETGVPGVYAIGDVKGGPAFTHISYDDFRILETNLLGGGSATIADRLVPYTVFIDPQLGRIGMTERSAAAAGRDVRIAKLPMSSVTRALEVGETRGFMKAVVDADTDRILGAAVLGINGGEIAAMLQLAMMGDLPYTALRDGVFTHPTLAESLNTLFTSFEDD